MKKTNDPAKESGLFGPAKDNAAKPAPNQKPTDKPPKPGKTKELTSENAKPLPNCPGSDKPSHSQEVKSEEIDENTTQTPLSALEHIESPQPNETFAVTKRRLFRMMSACIPLSCNRPEKQDFNHLIGIKCGEIAEEISRLRGLLDGCQQQIRDLESQLEPADPVASIDRAPPTKEELIGIISAAIRDEKATGSDVKGLTATLQNLLPELFGSSQDEAKPDPVAIISYLTKWDGRAGDAIVQELGGQEFIADQLSKALKTQVSVG